MGEGTLIYDRLEALRSRVETVLTAHDPTWVVSTEVHVETLGVPYNLHKITGVSSRFRYAEVLLNPGGAVVRRSGRSVEIETLFEINVWSQRTDDASTLNRDAFKALIDNLTTDVRVTVQAGVVDRLSEPDNITIDVVPIQFPNAKAYADYLTFTISIA